MPKRKTEDDADREEDQLEAEREVAREKARKAAIRMHRARPAYVGGPVTADVAPTEIAGFEDAGWVITPKSEKPAKGEKADKDSDGKPDKA